MEIHKPKPIHNWRDLFKEIGIIVIGVSIALTAEQAVEAVRDRNRAADARIHIRAETARNLHLLDLRAATEGCISNRLDEVNRLIAVSAAAKLPQEDLWIGRPFAFSVLDGRYKAATQSGSVSLFDDREQAEYAELYQYLDTYSQTQVGELVAWTDLRILEDHPAPSVALDLQLRNAMKRARSYRYYIQTLNAQIMLSAARYGFVPTAVRKRLDSVCVPLHTPRAQAQKAVIADRADEGTYDEP
jgi:hypothetical protein